MTGSGGSVGGGGGSSGSNGSSSGKKLWKKSQCMGGYCLPHGYHACDNNHTSTMCTFKKEGPKSDVTFDNSMGGNNYWLPVYCIIDSQKCTQYLWESPSPPSEMDRGMTKEKKKRRKVMH
jgi:hypothetical protein